MPEPKRAWELHGLGYPSEPILLGTLGSETSHKSEVHMIGHYSPEGDPSPLNW